LEKRLTRSFAYSQPLSGSESDKLRIRNQASCDALLHE